MKRFFLILLALILFATPVFGWELSMSGDYEYRYSHVSRTGPGDLFGNAKAAQSPGSPGITSIGLSGPAGGIVTPEGFSSKGADSGYTEERLWFYTNIRINPAVRIKTIYGFQGNLNGAYNGGSNWANPFTRAGWYSATSRSEEFGNVLATPMLKAVWAEVEMPIGLLRIGRRPFEFGLGWSGYHKDSTTMSGISFQIPFGPLAFEVGSVLHDSGEATDPSDMRNFPRTAYTPASAVDRNESRSLDGFASLIYQEGPFTFGALNRTIAYNKVHGLPHDGGTFQDDVTGSIARPFLTAYAFVGTGADQIRYPIYGDMLFLTNVLYAKYFNGRFFLNAEYDFQYINVTRQGGRPISGTPRAWMLEGGALIGPNKLSLAMFKRTGHDRQGGILDVSSTTGGTTTVRQVGDSWAYYLVTGGADAPIKPYAWLIGLYGTGNNSYDGSGYPTYGDFKAVAARLDHAIAANLNLWGSWILASRESNTGTWWGQYTGGLVIPPERGSNVPNTDLGQEFGAGLSWKLLENVVLDTQVAYWQPGDWFKFAYRDFSTLQTIPDPYSNTDVFINPARSIDPILGVKGSVLISF